MLQNYQMFFLEEGKEKKMFEFPQDLGFPQAIEIAFVFLKRDE